MISSSAKVPRPVMPGSGLPSMRKLADIACGPRLLAEEGLLAEARLADRAGRREGEDHVVPDRDAGHRPRPTSCTTPAPSWPSTAGGGIGIVPFTTERSE